MLLRTINGCFGCLSSYSEVTRRGIGSTLVWGLLPSLIPRPHQSVPVVSESLLVAEGGGHQLTFRRFKFQQAAVNPLCAASLGGELRVVLRAHGLLALRSVSTPLYFPPLVSSVKAGLPMIY